MIYVLACPRSATKAHQYAMGLDVWHERMGPRGCVGFPWKGDGGFRLDRFMGAVRREINADQDSRLIHLVREPLATISSLLAIRPFLDSMAPRLVPEVEPDDPPLVKAAGLWVHLNDAIAAAGPRARWKAEACLSVPDEIRDSRQGHPDYEHVTWARLWLEAPQWAGRAVLMAWEYGYDVSPHAFADITKETPCAP